MIITYCRGWKAVCSAIESRAQRSLKPRETQTSFQQFHGPAFSEWHRHGRLCMHFHFSSTLPICYSCFFPNFWYVFDVWLLKVSFIGCASNWLMGVDSGSVTKLWGLNDNLRNLVNFHSFSNWLFKTVWICIILVHFIGFYRAKRSVVRYCHDKLSVCLWSHALEFLENNFTAD